MLSWAQLLCLAASSVVVASFALATPVTLTMDEVPTQPINGLSVAKGGEIFTFADRRGNLLYNSTGPGKITYVQDPSIQGNSESFRVAFSVPVTKVQFGLAEEAFSPLTGARVILSDGSARSFDLPLADPFAEGQFTWSAPALTGFTLIPPPPFVTYGSLAFDNLTVDTVVPISSVPEPFSIVLLGIGLAGLGLAHWNRCVCDNGLSESAADGDEA